ncbi:MAG TPA: adenylate/guanylate cyclase domain-containing protein [Solirubrobacterales bacterium]|nr:adenylate/guanylate cyclase domain-containing protein [Solirubrobacterales bacterium]
MLLAPFQWLYEKLGPRYPSVFVSLELQAGFLVTAGTVVLLAAYYNATFDDFLKLLVVAMALTAGALAWGYVRIRPVLVPIRAWINGVRDEAATARAWTAAVGLPLTLVRRGLTYPIIGVVLPSCVTAVIVLDLSWLDFFPLLFAGIVAAGYGAILHHLTVESGMRPILIDINRSASPRIETDVPALSLRWRLLTALPMINVITGFVVAAIAGADSLGVSILIVIGVATTISLELTILLSRSVLGPLADLKRATDAVAEGNLDVAVPITTADEIGELAASFNQMVEGLRERERIRQAFGVYLDREVAEHILSEGFSEGGELIEISILFCDVKDFTAFAESAEPEEVVACLNALFEVVVPVIASTGGHVDKFEGDGLMAVFGAPERVADHADRALRAALEIDRLVNEEGRGGGFRVGIGVNTGEVVAGSIGGGGRLNFSVIGDPVNVAARVEAATRETGDALLVTAATRDRLRGGFELESRGEYDMKGIERPVRLYAPPRERDRRRSPDPIDAVRSVYARVRGGDRTEG